MRILLTFIAIVCVFSGAIAQDKFGAGYYVKNTADTVHGLVEYRTNYNNGFRFRENLGGKTQHLSIEDVKSFSFPSGVTYARVEYSLKENLPAAPVFIRPLVKGELDLFYYRGKMFIGSDTKGRFALAPRTSNAAEAMKNYQKNAGVFNILFQDCSSVKEAAQKTVISEENLVELLRSYHECRHLPYQEFKKRKLKRSVDFGFFAGQALSSLAFGKSDPKSITSNYLYHTKFQTSSNPTLGLIALIGGRSLSSVLSFQSELTYTKADFKASYTFSDPDFGGYSISQTSTTSVNYSRLALSGGLRLTARSNTLNPYVSFALAAQQFLTLNTAINQVTTINASVEEENSTLDISKSSGAVLMSGGIKKKIARNKALFAECNYENSNFSINEPKTASVSVVSFRAGFLF